MAKYDALVDLLESRGTERVDLSFAEIGAVLEGGLPDSAYTHPAWWANDSVAHQQSRAWLAAGWRADGLFLGSQRVTFVRDERGDDELSHPTVGKASGAPGGGTDVDAKVQQLAPLTAAATEAMRGGGSIFTPWSSVWTSEAATELVQCFVEQPDEGGRSFNEKLDDQLRDASDPAVQLFAELFCLNLAPLSDYKPDTKRRLIRDILARMDAPVALPEDIETALRTSAFNGGVSFKTRRPFQLALLVRVAAALTSLPEDERRRTMSDREAFAELLNSIEEPNEPSQRKSLRYLLFPDYYLPVVSRRHGRAIRDGFKNLLDGSEPDLDAELYSIADALSGGNGVRGVNFYASPHIDVWDPGREFSGVPVTYEELGLRSSFKTPRYALATAAVGLIDEGLWSTYSDVGVAVGLIGGQVGDYLSNVPHDNGHRVIKFDGTTYEVEQRRALEAEGVPFDTNGVADPARRVTGEDLREQLDALGLLPKVSKRAWLVRGNSIGGNDYVPSWLESGEVGLAASALRELEPGVTRDDVKAAVEEDYSHTSYSARAELVDAFHYFLTRMQVDDVVVTVDQGRIHIGRITGEPEFRPEGGVHLVRAAEWYGGEGVDYSDVPSEIASKLKVQRDVLDLTQHVDKLEELLDAEATDTEPPPTKELQLAPPTLDLARELHVEVSWLQEVVDLLNDRPQLIFYGPPGTGKTYLAQKIAKFAAGDNVELVQFHTAYSYEDFMEGFRPTKEGGFELKPGPMRTVVDKAADNPDTPYFLIIDEINRGNLAKVFGELYFLLEYRDENVRLLYSDEPFVLPKNVYIIGTMNTADRSIALVDAAMRRRFAFLPLHPSEEPTSDLLRRWLDAEGLPLRVADLHDELNRRIDDPDFKIGPSYFMRKNLYDLDAVAPDYERHLRRVWKTSILPLLEEHHFGEKSATDVAALYGYDEIAAVVDGSSMAEEAELVGDDAAPGTD